MKIIERAVIISHRYIDNTVCNKKGRNAFWTIFVNNMVNMVDKCKKMSYNIGVDIKLVNKIFC